MGKLAAALRRRNFPSTPSSAPTTRDTAQTVLLANMAWKTGRSSTAMCSNARVPRSRSPSCLQSAPIYKISRPLEASPAAVTARRRATSPRAAHRARRTTDCATCRAWATRVTWKTKFFQSHGTCSTLTVKTTSLAIPTRQL